ncbi:MAG: hypothetical protein SynsKO_45270 [Synoicihabitans sp.]
MEGLIAHRIKLTRHVLSPFRGDVRTDIVHHSNRGSTCASDRYQRLLTKWRMQPSMSAKGNCYDNAAMESFFGRYKITEVHHHIFANEF